ncbi:MAG: D-alanyl-D-alanine carboxypeptidase family protein [Candidatus Peregrinibacteria bacterium]
MSTTETPEPPLLPNFGLASVIDSYASPVKSSQFISPIIEAKSAIAIDVESGAVLFEKNAHERRAIASITKLMTMTIILEENELTETATVSANAAAIEGSTMYLRPGENITVENLLYGAIINSANDAAVALAEHNAGTVSEFVEKMNKKALSLGLVNTHFSNPIGLDHPDNYSSAYDIAKLSRYIYQYEFIRQAAQLKDFEVSSIDEKYKHKLNSTNDLLDSYLHIKGLKTGRTDTAGLCMVAVAEKNENNEIITVVLNSPARFTETKILVDWVFRAYSW